MKNNAANRFTVTLLLGFSSGLPLSLSGNTLQAWLTTEHINLMTIGWFGLLSQPYLYKFLWAPFLDRYRPPFGGNRRGWMMIMQLLLCLSFLACACLSPSKNIALIGTFAFLIALFSATQDIAVDAYRTELLELPERGMGSALYTGGYRLALLWSGGLALLFADHLGWPLMFCIMAASVLPGFWAAYQGPEPAEASHLKKQRHLFLDPLKDFWKRQNAVALLLLILFYKLGEALTSALTMNFLLGTLGFSLSMIGATYKTIALLATLGGMFLGGFLYTRLGLYRSLLYFGILQALPITLFWMLTWVGHSTPLMLAAVSTETFCSGMATSAFMSLLMALCHVRYTATQFAFLSAIAASGRIFGSPIAALIVLHSNWATLFLSALALTLPGLYLVYHQRHSLKKM